MNLGQFFKQNMSGVLITLGITILAVVLQMTPLFTTIIPFSSLILAILLGMIIRNFFILPQGSQAGIKLSASKILRLGIILLGFKISVQELATMGPGAMAGVIVASGLTFIFIIFVAKKMKIPSKRALLLASGISICGASAVAAVDSVIQGKEEDVAFALGVITLFGTVFMFLYPIIFQFISTSPLFYALWTGSSIHEVAQVTAAAAVIPEPFRTLASSVKLMRVMLILPLTLILSFIPGVRSSSGEATVKEGKKLNFTVPWFAILFFVMVVVNSLPFFPGVLRRPLGLLDSFLLTMAMAGLGLGISFKAFLKVGKKALLLGILGSVFLSVVAGIISFYLSHL